MLLSTACLDDPVHGAVALVRRLQRLGEPRPPEAVVGGVRVAAPVTVPAVSTT